MSFRLKEAIFKVRCREHGCPFFSEFVVKENIMGATEMDVDTEAQKIARNMGYIKHDALFGRKHPLANPEIFKISSSYERIGTTPAYATAAHAGPAAPVTPPGIPPAPAPTPFAPTRTYKRGEIIIRKGESAVTVCEVLHGSAVNEKLPALNYKAGSTFGAAAIFRHKNRMVDIVAGEDGTTIAFYNIREMSKTNPAKARALYDEAMEDIFFIVQYLEAYSSSLEKQVKKLQAVKKAATPPAVKKAARPKKAAHKTRPKKAAPKAAARKAAKPKKAPARKAAAKKPRKR
jgi:hypothetical protein